jgi:NO-binding membrane sensor protein with MHYT domain
VGGQYPLGAVLLSVPGNVLGLACAVRARGAAGPARLGWLAGAALAIGGVGVWLMHFVALLGAFGGPHHGRPGYDPRLTLWSLALAVGVVAVGLVIAESGGSRFAKVGIGGTFTGVGLAAMHFIGLDGVRVGGVYAYRPSVIAAAVLVAVGAAIGALWLLARVSGPRARFGAAGLLTGAVAAAHYLGMAGVRIEPRRPPGLAGADPLLLLLPMTVLLCAWLVASTASGAASGAAPFEGDTGPADGARVAAR